jgi:hypothetical protein
VAVAATAGCELASRVTTTGHRATGNPGGGGTVLAAGAPAWCSGLGGVQLDRHGEIKDLVENNDPRDALANLVAALCNPDSDVDEHKGQLESARKKWSSRLDLAEADWVDVATYATLNQGARMAGLVKLYNDSEQTRKRAWSSFDALDQYAMIANDIGESGSLTLDHNYFVDALGKKLTESGRLAYVARCIKEKEPVQWAMCQGDIERLDFKALAAELRDNKVYGGEEKIRVRIEAAELRDRLVEHRAKVQKLTAGDPGYAKLFQLAEATRRDWEERTSAPLVDLVAQMDDARATRSTKAFDGCEDKTWAAWTAAVAELPAKAFEGLHDNPHSGRSLLDEILSPIITTPNTYLASVARVTCMTAGQADDVRPDLLTRFLGAQLVYWPGFRGPRTATESAILSAGIRLDDRDAKLGYPRPKRPFGSGGGLSSHGSGAGVIGKLLPSGKGVTVEFKAQMVRQVQCAEVRETNHAIQIRDDGSLIYAVTCVRNETVTVNKADEPQKVNPRYLDGVKPGMYVKIVEDVAVATWAKPGTPAPTMVFGVKLK